MKKLLSVFISLVTASTFVFAPFVSMAQTDNTATVLAGLTQQIRVLQELVSSLQARFAALGRSSMAQVGAGVIGITSDPVFVVNDVGTDTFRLGAANPSRAYTQSFKAPMDGKLKQLHLFVAAPQNGNPTKPIHVSIRSTLGGPAITAETVVPSMPVSKTLTIPTKIVVDFTNPPSLQKDSTYYVEYAVAAPYDSKNYYRLVVGEGNPYKDGTLYYANGQKIAVYDMVMSMVIGSNAVPTVNNGGWSVSSAPSAPTEKWVVAGSTNVLVNVLRFTATTEDFALTNLRLSLRPDAKASDVDKISLYDGSTLIASGIPSFTGGITDFNFPTSGTGSFRIPKDTYKEMTIKIDLPCIGSACSGRAGQRVAVDFEGSDTSKNKAVGMSSGTEVHTSTNFDIGAPGIRYFRSLPTVERLPLPVTTLSSGNLVLYKFKVTADKAYDVALHKVTFKVATTGVTAFTWEPPSFTLWNTTDNKRVAAATGAAAAFFTKQENYDASNQLIVRVYANTTDYTNAWVTVPAGQTHTFELRGNITTDGSGDSVSTQLLGDVTIVPKMSSVNGIKSSQFIWSDFSADATTTHSVYTADWMNGYLVPGLVSGLGLSTMSN